MDPAQTFLLILAINYIEEVERFFRNITGGDANSLTKGEKR